VATVGIDGDHCDFCFKVVSGGRNWKDRAMGVGCFG